ncbi:hypothetical protein RirG_063490 [Rhizophagus irregularis DAOM 197198w]|uniref:Uncharacterized protein n=1 Tax=Rhizophagus irregularis (strain DAOM 197198w) TaxID=1432141 RepID=A0A015KZS4_RHIIW|nr:hypothetical protein RirG_063490 [Rhizophagus irregularis DAOM 197198w]
MIEQFKIGRDFTISQERQHTIIVDGDDEGKETTSINDENFGCSIDISNLYTKDVNKYFIYVALSRIVDKELLTSTLTSNPKNSQMTRSFANTAIHHIDSFQKESVLCLNPHDVQLTT